MRVSIEDRLFQSCCKELVCASVRLSERSVRRITYELDHSLLIQSQFESPGKLTVLIPWDDPVPYSLPDLIGREQTVPDFDKIPALPGEVSDGISLTVQGYAVAVAVLTG